MVAAVILGGLIGSYLSNEKLNVNLIRRLTAVLVAYVGIRLVLIHGFQMQMLREFVEKGGRGRAKS
jgi:uncharacterized membrane protein YfcA